MLTELDIENIQSALENGSCLVFLGEELFRCDDGRLVSEAFAELLVRKYLVPQKVAFDEASRQNLPYIAQRCTSISRLPPARILQEMKDFVAANVNQPTRAHRLAAQLSARLFVSATPDSLMFKALQASAERPRPFVEQRYYSHYRDVFEKWEEPTEERPLVYNIFGQANDFNSLVVTERDEIDFFCKLIDARSPDIPTALTKEFDERKTYLFLGFAWDSWQLKLLLKILNMDKRFPIFSPLQQDIRPHAAHYYETQFDNFTFVQGSTEAFLEKILAAQNGAPTAPEEKCSVVFLHHPDDEDEAAPLLTHWKGLARARNAQVWERSDVLGGYVREATDAAIQAADVLVLALTANLIADDTFYNVELPLALAQKQRGATVVGLVLKPCAWDNYSSLRGLYPIWPEKGEPLSALGEAGRKYVTEQLSALLVDCKSKRP